MGLYVSNFLIQSLPNLIKKKLSDESFAIELLAGKLKVYLNARVDGKSHH